MTHHLRSAISSDAPALGAIMQDFIANTPWMPKLHRLPQTIDHCATMIERGWVKVAVWRGHVGGFISRQNSDVHALFIAPDVQRRHLGHHLIRDAQMQSLELNLWTFQANTGAQRFYLREGFTEVCRSDGATNDEKLPDIQFRWIRGHA